MALVKAEFFKDNAYHRISSVTVHRDKLRVIIRTEIFESEEVRKSGGKHIADREYEVSAKAISDRCYTVAKKEAERNLREIEALAEKEFRALPASAKIKGKPVTIDTMIAAARNTWIAKRTEQIGAEEVERLKRTISTGKQNVIEIGYQLLSQMDYFAGAKRV